MEHLQTDVRFRKSQGCRTSLRPPFAPDQPGKFEPARVLVSPWRHPAWRLSSMQYPDV